MNDLVILHREPSTIGSPRSEVRLAANAYRPLIQPIEDRQFQTMEGSYSQHGGLASADEVTRRLRLRSDQPISDLARWIVARTIVSFVWRSRTLIPLFQFDLQNMSLRTGAAGAVAGLSGVFDDRELASWFVQANVWLRNTAPIDRINDDESAVLAAVRADRFVARGQPHETPATQSLPIRSACLETTRQRRLPPRLRYPNVSVVRLYRSPLAKLAWIFGFGR